MAVMTRTFGALDLSDPAKAADYVKRKALEYGADAVGIGNIERWADAPIQMDPKQIMPECKSIIAMAFRVERGSLRGVEEGTFFSNYSAMGYGGITYMYMPMTVINLSKVIEDEGYEAVPMGHQSDWRGIDNSGFARPEYSRPVRPGQAQPDIMIHLRFAGFLCGLGEIGLSKMLLTPQFGPRHRVGIVLTDLELEPDPIYDGPRLCNNCRACVNACPGKCFKDKNTVRVNLAGHEVSYIEPELSLCDRTFRGEDLTDQVQPNPYEPLQPKSRPGWWTPFYHTPRHLYNTGQAVCGSRGCTRACMMSLEQRGVIANQFKEKFRRRPAWRVDWETEPEYAPGTVFPKKIDTSKAD